MYAVKGSFKDGMAMPDEPVQGREGERVLIMFLPEGAEEIDEEIDDVPTIEEVVAKIKALGPNPANYTPPTKSLAELLANARDEEPIDAAEWDRQWALIEDEIKKG